MKNFGFLAFGALALAIPLEKRSVVYHTVVEEVFETVYTTTTLWLGDTAPTATKAAPAKSSVAAAVVPTTSSTTTPEAAAATSTVQAAVDPAETTPAGKTPIAAAVTIPTVVDTPTTTATPEVAPAATKAAVVTSSDTSSSSSSGTGTHTGDITYYEVDVGLGSCGTTATNDEAVVALSHLDMNNGANPNNNPLCGTYINIFYNGQTHKARIFDTCPSCAAGSLDLSPTLFTAVAPAGDGRVHGVSWSFA